MKRLVDLTSPDDRAGAPRKGWTADQRVSAAAPSGRVDPPTGEAPTPEPADRSIVRGVRWDPSHNTVGGRHATGSRGALDYHPPERPSKGVRWKDRAAARSTRLAPRALARAKAGK